jgi:hypothetical protein
VRQNLRHKAIGPFSQTQMFIRYLDEDPSLCRYTIGPDGRLVGMFWTFPICLEMLRDYPHMLSMDST